MSEIGYGEIKLTELSVMASVILVVTKTSDELESRSIDIVHNGKDYPPFSYSITKFVVKEVLRGDGMKVNGEIEVYPANFDTMYDTHKRYVVDGMNTSPLYEYYVPQMYEEDDMTFILFLTYTQNNHLSYFCLNSFDGLSIRNQISLDKNSSIGISNE